MCIKLQLTIYFHSQELYLIFTHIFIPIQIKFYISIFLFIPNGNSLKFVWISFHFVISEPIN